MKTTLLLITIALSFFLTSCYTQFATVREDEPYVIKREKTYKKYEPQEENEDAYYQDDEQQYAEDDDEYYEDENDSEAVVEYHYSSRPYVYLYRFTHYDPWYDEYVYYNRPVTVISVRLAPRYGYYDPYWAGFYCSPYDYCDPWFGWCGYGYASYYPYYYGHYYYDRYYGGYWGYYGHRRHGYYNNYSRDYYASNWGRRPFTSSRAGMLTARPERPDRATSVARPDRPMEMPASRPMIARPEREKQPYTLERPVRKIPGTIDTQPAVYTKKTGDEDRKYTRKYYNSSDRIKSELDNSRNDVKKTTPRQQSEDTKNDSYTNRPARETYKYNTDRREQRDNAKTREPKAVENVQNEKPRPTRDTYREERQQKTTVTRPKSSKSYEPTRSTKSKERDSKSGYTPKTSKTRSSDSKSSYSPGTTKSKSSDSKSNYTPRSSSGSSKSSSSRSTYRSAPPKSSYSGSSGRSSSGRSSSSRSSSSSSRSGSSSGKRPR